MYVLLYACMCVLSMYLCIKYVCMYEYMYVLCIKYVCMYVRMNVCIKFVCMYVRTYVCITYVCMFICIYVCNVMYVCIYICNVCMYMCMCVCLCVYLLGLPLCRQLLDIFYERIHKNSAHQPPIKDIGDEKLVISERNHPENSTR